METWKEKEAVEQAFSPQNRPLEDWQLPSLKPSRRNEDGRRCSRVLNSPRALMNLETVRMSKKDPLKPKI